MSHPTVTVISAVLNGASVYGSQLEALATQGADFEWEYVIVDNGSTDATLNLVRDIIPRFPVEVRIVDGSARRGVPYARNLGVAAARGRLIVFCDQDDIVDQSWLAAAVDGLQEAPAVMGMIRSLADGLSPSARVMNPSIFSRRPVVESCNFGIHKEVLQSVGGFDEELPAYGLDDSELAIRLRKAGHEIRPLPEMVVWARQSTSIRQRIRKVYSSARAEIHVWRKHPDLFSENMKWSSQIKDVLRSMLAVRDLIYPRCPEGREKAARRIITAWGHLIAFAQLSRQ